MPKRKEVAFTLQALRDLRDLNQHAALTLAVLMVGSDKNGDVSIGYDALMKSVNIGARTLMRTLADLVDSGWLKKYRIQYSVNKYCVHPATLKGATVVTHCSTTWGDKNGPTKKPIIPADAPKLSPLSTIVQYVHSEEEDVPSFLPDDER